MISIKKALKIIENNIPCKTTEYVSINKCCNKVLAEDIITHEPLPRYTNSSMDGFAVKWEDIRNTGEDSLVSLEIIGESRAGIPFDNLIEKGQTVSISTGGLLPEGADTVVPLELAELDGKTAIIRKVVDKGKYIRYRGQEIEKGKVILKKGQVFNPACIGLLASIGTLNIKIYKSPNVSITTTGTELMPLDADLEEYQIRNSNALMLEKAIENSGAKVISNNCVSDDIELLQKKISEVEVNSDLIILSGGVSVGPHDFVKQAAKNIGFEQLFWKVNQKPGKPLFVATKENKMLFGLPGNPVSALTAYVFYVHPVIQKLLGKKNSWHIVEGTLNESVSNKSKRVYFKRIRLQNDNNLCGIVTPVVNGGSHMLTSIAYANGFIVVEPGITIKKDEKVKVYLYPWEL
ncbi:gephyrin-like molybdotransferase Glp [Bacteroidota bacterium]